VGIGAGFGEIEAVEVHVFDPACERFGRLRYQFRRRAAENEESCRGIGPIGEHPQTGERLRAVSTALW